MRQLGVGAGTVYQYGYLPPCTYEAQRVRVMQREQGQCVV